MNVSSIIMRWHVVAMSKAHKLIFMLALIVTLPGVLAASSSELLADDSSYVVAAYYFPNWHVDPINELRWKKPWTEWDILREAEPKFPGHLQPKMPVWGYQMEDRAEVMAQKINAAVEHGVNAFIFDWYFHESGGYLEGALNQGFLNAPNRNKIRFAIMWANHRLHEESGEVSIDTFDKISDHLVKDYFTNPSYLLVDGKAYFSIYEVGTFIQGLGGIQNARDALNRLKTRAIKAGLKGVHVNVVDWQLKNRPDAAKLLKVIGADSVTTYTWVHHVPLMSLGFPTVDYMAVANRYFEYAKQAKSKYGMSYYPNVTVGWDPTPRMKKGQPFDGRGYPNTPVIVGNTPEQFTKVLQQVKADLKDIPTGQRIITIDAWNEWGEGAYLEPDTVNGMEYLNAIHNVFSIESN